MHYCRCDVCKQRRAGEIRKGIEDKERIKRARKGVKGQERVIREWGDCFWIILVV